ncbi:MAG: 3-deoxy-manno-octulosonate cytidylyltransferase [bacterium]
MDIPTTEDVICVIPARWGSTRFPGKAIAEIEGSPMIQWVVRRAMEAEEIDAVYVATDDERILDAVEPGPAEGIITSKDHTSGSDRVAEVARDHSADIVVNVQGDEPLTSSRGLDRGIRALKRDPEADVTTFAYQGGKTEYHNPDNVKIVRDHNDRALYFSRSPIPHNESVPETVLVHIGIYIYRYEALIEFTESQSAPLETSEDLEQLRLMQKGKTYKIVELEEPTVGVDRPEDVEKVENELGRRGEEDLLQ